MTGVDPIGPERPRGQFLEVTRRKIHADGRTWEPERRSGSTRPSGCDGLGRVPKVFVRRERRRSLARLLHNGSTLSGESALEGFGESTATAARPHKPTSGRRPVWAASPRRTRCGFVRLQRFVMRRPQEAVVGNGILTVEATRSLPARALNPENRPTDGLYPRRSRRPLTLLENQLPPR